MKLKLLLPLLLVTLLSACSSWVFRIDVSQGNYLVDKDLENLRVGMSKEQVIFVMGRPVIRDTFDNDVFYYVYKLKRGMKSSGEDFRKDLYLHFEGDKLVKMTGDFDEPENFNTPLDS